MYQYGSTRSFSTEPVLDNKANPPPPSGPLPTPAEEKGEGGRVCEFSLSLSS